ncbi:hypothetical protein [Nocardia sp. Marseille-Q1738]
MAKKPALADDQVREILLMAVNHPIAEIALKFDRHPNTIDSILRGRSYKHITMGAHTEVCTCRGCVINRRREENERRGDAAQLEGVCVRCGNETTVRATALLRRPGLVTCNRCRGRKS